LLGRLGCLDGGETSVQSTIIEKLLRVIEHDDARVRAEALRTLVSDRLRDTNHDMLYLYQVDLFKCQVALDPKYYSAFVECLQDYYAEVRLAACEALYLLALRAPDQ
jgi:hypothetical protein